MKSLHFRIRTIAAILLLCAFVARADETTPASASLPQQVLSEAKRIQTQMKESTYTHKTKVDEEAKSYDLDCSGLAGYVLKRVSIEHYKAIKNPHKRVRPLAEDFQATFADAPDKPAPGQLWQHIPRLADARPGDLIAWSKPERKPGDSTGHVVILSAEPRDAGQGVFKVPVIDSTTVCHDDDTRKNGANGVGAGTMFIRVNENGAPDATKASSKTKAWAPHPISIGRPISKSAQ